MSRKKKLPNTRSEPPGPAPKPNDPDIPLKLEVVLKCDSAGSVEAVRSAIESISVPGVRIQVIQAGVGRISKKDVLMAQTGSRLVLGFEVDTVPRMDMDLEARCVEIRIYKVIYNLTADLEKIARSLLPREAEETLLGRGRVIAVFPDGKKGLVAGCDITSGVFVSGKPFRLITPMGPVFTGDIDSLQVARRPVKQARAGQQAGVYVPGRRRVNLGDEVECFEVADARTPSPWQPTCGIFHKD
jgi:translation initiation factor IF-2